MAPSSSIHNLFHAQALSTPTPRSRCISAAWPGLTTNHHTTFIHVSAFAHFLLASGCINRPHLFSSPGGPPAPRPYGVGSLPLLLSPKSPNPPSAQSSPPSSHTHTHTGMQLSLTHNTLPARPWYCHTATQIHTRVKLGSCVLPHMYRTTHSQGRGSRVCTTAPHTATTKQMPTHAEHQWNHKEGHPKLSRLLSLTHCSNPPNQIGFAHSNSTHPSTHSISQAPNQPTNQLKHSPTN